VDVIGDLLMTSLPMMSIQEIESGNGSGVICYNGTVRFRWKQEE